MGPKRQGPYKAQQPAESKPSATSDGGSITPKLSKKKENYVPWHKSATLYLGGKFGRSATFMETGKGWAPDPVVMPSNAEVAAMNEVEKAITIDNVKELTKARNRIVARVKDEDEPQMFAILLGSLDADSYDTVTNHEDWVNLKVSKDCAAFLQLIETTHYSLAKVSILDQSRAMDNYNLLRQFPNESIAAYKLRFDDAVQRCKALACPEIGEPILACQYIKGLDAKRYSGMKVDLENNSRHGISVYPANLAAAHRIASTWVVSTNERGKPQVADDKIVFAADKGKAKKGKGKESPDESKTEEKVETTGDGKFRGKCFNCGVFGHRIKECTKPKREKVEEKDAHLSVSLEAYAVAAGNGSNLLGLDTMANVSIFTDAASVTNIRDRQIPVVVKGIGGKRRLNKICDHPLFGSNEDFIFDPECPMNILSLSHAKTFSHAFIDNENDVIVLDMPGQSLIFECQNGMYLCDMDKYEMGVDKDVYVTTVEDMKRLYTTREVEAANVAKEFIVRMGNPSAKNVVAAVRGGMADIPFTAQDIYRAYKIWGPDLGAVRGKTMRTTEDAVVTGDIKGLLAPLDLEMHADVMFVEGLPFFTAVLTPLCYTIVELLKGRTAGVVKAVINKVLAMVRGQGYNISWILSDGEGAIVALKEELNLDVTIKARVNTTAAGDHVPVVENKIKQIKGGVRGILATLPYLVPLFFIAYLVSHVVFCINMFPSRATSENVAPYESFTGRKPSGKDFPLAFGEYVEVHEKRAVTNTMEARTQSAIYLGQSGNVQKSGKFYSLSTGGVVVRSRWTKFPMPSLVIKHLSDLADKKGAARRDPVFQIYEHVVMSDEEPRGGVPTMPTRNVYDDLHEVLVNLPEEEEETVRKVSFQLPDMEPSPVASESSSSSPSVPSPEEGVELADTADYSGTDAADYSGTDVFEDQSTLRSDFDIVGGVEDGIDGADDGAVEQEVIQPTIQQQPIWGADRLRGDRKYGHKDGGWREKKFNMLSFKEDERFAFKISIKEAMTKFPQATNEALTMELSQLHERGCFKPVRYNDLPWEKKKKVIRSSLFLKEKFDSTGAFQLLKARLVAGGHMQDRSLYEEEDITSPTVQLSSLYMSAAIAANEGRKVATIDFPGAYLNADLEQEVFMRIDARLGKVLMAIAPDVYRGFLNDDGDLIVQLKKALYGLGESAKLWNDLLSKELTSRGFKANAKDSCAFNKMFKGHQITVLVYVDDLFITCKDEEAIDDFFNSMSRCYSGLKMKKGPVISYLGQTFDFSAGNQCKVTMEGYLKDILKAYDVKGVAATPAGPDLFAAGEAPLLSKELTEIFHSRVAKLFYLAKRVRPDILTATAWLATRVQVPSSVDWEKLNRVLKYLAATPDLGLVFKGDIVLKAYIDASYAAHDDCRSQSGVVLKLGQSTIYVSSQKQKLNSKSSTEAELIALSDGLTQVLWAREYLMEQGYEMSSTVIFQDNKSTILLARKGTTSSQRTRHINTRYFWIKDRIQAGELVVEYLPTEEMMADMLTKPLQGEAFKKMRWEMLGGE